jgi:hypothetical protein
MPTIRKKKFGKMSKMMEGVCFIIVVIGSNRANTGKDKDDDDHYSKNIIPEFSSIKCYCSIWCV